MKDAIGGVFTIQIILVFMVIINAYLAFSVNYTKAFRIKNNIVSLLEQQEGLTKNAEDQITNIMKDTGYNVNSAVLSKSCNGNGYNGYKAISNQYGGFCLKANKNASGVGGYYSVKTYVSIDVPILRNLFKNFSDIFAITGETKTIYSDNFGLGRWES